MRELIPAWPPNDCRSTTTVRKPLGRAVDGGGEPGWPGADDDEVVVRELLVRLEADALGKLGGVGGNERLGVGGEDDRQPVGVSDASASSCSARASSTSSQ